MKLLFLPLLFVALAGGQGIAFADDSQTPNLIITGTVTTDSCAVSTESKNLNVSLGDIITGVFNQSGDTNATKAFVITLTDCDAGVAGATITFTGTSDSDNPDLLQITKEAGSATGVGVEILDSRGAAVPLGEATATQTLTAGENKISYQLHYKSTMDTVTAGSANAVMYFDLAYQ